jgi:hypothetical protein
MLTKYALILIGLERDKDIGAFCAAYTSCLSFEQTPHVIEQYPSLISPLRRFWQL